MSIKPARTPRPATAPLFADQSSEYCPPGVHLLDEAFDALLHFVAQGMDEAEAKDAARGAITRVWKGSRWYVSGQNDISARNAAIVRDYQRGERPALLERRYGLKKVQIWRIINALPSH
jgi:Mor family transcriptional regulator